MGWPKDEENYLFSEKEISEWAEANSFSVCNGEDGEILISVEHDEDPFIQFNRTNRTYMIDEGSHYFYSIQLLGF